MLFPGNKLPVSIKTAYIVTFIFSVNSFKKKTSLGLCALRSVYHTPFMKSCESSDYGMVPSLWAFHSRFCFITYQIRALEERVFTLILNLYTISSVFNLLLYLKYLLPYVQIRTFADKQGKEKGRKFNHSQCIQLYYE